MSAVNSPVKRALSSPISEQAVISSSLPSPSTFDIVPALYTLICRLLPTATSNEPPLEPQHLVVEASTVKIKLQKAVLAVEALPDVDRTVEEQEAEIQELESRIKQQRDMLASLAQRARAACGREPDMTS